MSKECLSQIRSRRSIRRFTSEPFDEGEINDIVKVGFSAPSAGNLQPWRVVIVTNQEVKEQLSNAAGGQAFLAKASVVFVVCGVPEESAERYKERGRTLYVLQDTAALTLNILHAAHILGYGACWIGAFNEEEVSTILRIPQNMRPVAMIPVGKIEGNLPEMRPRRDLSEVIIRERFR
ncbi:nitroreductase family protein [Candidatus Thorarchaeota archaeon]|nr:MAG: nitroreductase family protein [Candidatus Thorarchaeota archaeon]